MMDVGIRVLIIVVLFSLVSVLNAPLLSQRLAVREESSLPDSKLSSFNQLFHSPCIVYNNVQHVSITNQICFSVGVDIIIGGLGIIVLLLVIGTCWLCYRKCKGEITRLFQKWKMPKISAVQKYAQLRNVNLLEEQSTEVEVVMETVRVAKEAAEKKMSEVKNERNRARMKQEKFERDRAKLSEKLFKDTHKHFKHCQDIGSRLQKYWMLRGESMQRWSALQFTAKMSNKCFFSMEDEGNIDALNKLFQDLRHPYLQRVYRVACIEDYVSVLQNYVPEGSLRDRMYRVDPMKDWSEKCNHSSYVEVLNATEVATCIRHIGEAILVLYEVGFPAIGQVHTGNIFLEDGRYVLGGFENTLLGYRTSQYAAIKKEGLLDAIDIIMIGHLVYEISSGTYLQEICPSKDFRFDGVGNTDIQEFIRFIFSMDVRESQIKAIEQILNHSFVKDVEVEKKPPLEISQKAKHFLQIITNLKSRQNIPGGISRTDIDIIQVLELITADYMDRRAIERIGWRPEKVWATAKHSRWGEVLLSAAVVPYTCPISVQPCIPAINELLAAVQEHPNIHGILEMLYMKEGGRPITVSVQLLKKLSLRDMLYKSEPLEKWENKYKKVSKCFYTEQIVHYGSQVLDALLFLYNLGFPPIGQVTSGNIFIEGDSCQLGGYDNVLLGHRTESYISIKEFTGSAIDVFMFGTVLEMATGKHITTLPTKQDYEHENKELKDVLVYIFEQKHSIPEVRNHTFFTDRRNGDVIQSPSLSKSVRVLLQKVRKGKWKDQNLKGHIMTTIRKRPISLEVTGAGSHSGHSDRGFTNSNVTHLSVDDFETVKKELYDARSRWRAIGLALKIKLTLLDVIGKENQEIDRCFEIMLQEWLQNGSNKNWNTLACVLESETVRRKDISNKIKEKYC